MSEKTPFPQSKRYKSPDGTIRYIWDGKLHNWDGPALIPEGNSRQREYYLYGMPYSEEEWQEAKRNRSGLPWYKNAATKERS